MLNVFLTKALATELGITSGNAHPTSNNPKLSWLGHLIELNGKKFAIFINETSLFSIVLEITKDGDLWKTFRDRLGQFFRELQMEDSDIDEYLAHFEQITIFQLQDKKLLGKVNSIVSRAKKPVSDICRMGLPLRMADTLINAESPSKRKRGKCQCPTCAMMEIISEGIA
ncbi:MAG: hypothetical protein V1913_10635 [Fibrobacterota bacterium]